MANYKWPNVYANIKDLSGVVATNSVTSCGYVGEAEFGPINKPTFLSSLKDYTSKFGVLNSAKYGYAGYSLAVASESINSHYFVRTVKAGPNADTGKHDADDAMYASIKIPANKSDAVASGFGWYVEEIEAVEKTEDASTLFNNRVYSVRNVVLSNQGINYRVNDELAIALDQKNAKLRVAQVEPEFTIDTARVVTNGSGYVNGELLEIALDKTPAVLKAIVENTESELSFTTTGDLSETDVTINKAEFEAKLNTTGIYTFLYDGDWGYDSEIVDLAEYGIAVTGTPSNGDTIVVDYKAGDNSGKLIGVSVEVHGLSSVMISDIITVTGQAGSGATVELSMLNTGKIKELEIIDAGESTTNEIPTAVELLTETGIGAEATGTMTLSKLDLDDALIFVADNPNNLKLAVRLTDSTINENKAYSFVSLTYIPGNGGYIGTIHGVASEVLEGLVAGDIISISRTNKKNQEGNFEVLAIEDDEITFNYVSTDGKAPEDLSNGKVSKYPAPRERTFQVDVYLTKGKLTQNVETYQYCTLYHAKDNYNNSMFIEDVINGTSDYVKVYVNPNLVAGLDEDAGEVLEPTLTDYRSDPIALIGGQSGGKPSSNDLNSAWALYNDRTQTNVSLLLNSGYTNKDETSYQDAMLKVAENRRDCFCLFDIPMTNVDPEAAIDWRKNILGKTSYRAAVSAPWVRTYDSVQGRANFVMCPSAFLAKLIGAAGDPWHAPAGPNRGIISSSTVSPTGLTQAYDDAIGGTLYADNQINCIIRDAVAGYVNWGQRTLQAKPSALDRINVARTVIYIETILRDAARWHLFENNTPYERMQITLQFSAFLDTILSADGIAAYKVICDTSNNTPIVIANNQLVIDVILTPVYAAESIILNTTITGADASVDISSSAG